MAAAKEAHSLEKKKVTDDVKKMERGRKYGIGWACCKQLLEEVVHRTHCASSNDNGATSGHKIGKVQCRVEMNILEH